VIRAYAEAAVIRQGKARPTVETDAAMVLQEIMQSKTSPRQVGTSDLLHAHLPARRSDGERRTYARAVTCGSNVTSSSSPNAKEMKYHTEIHENDGGAVMLRG
jgi:hypothetical protein